MVWSRAPWAWTGETTAMKAAWECLSPILWSRATLSTATWRPGIIFRRELAQQTGAAQLSSGGLGNVFLRYGQCYLAGHIRRQRPRISASGFDPRRRTL